VYPSVRAVGFLTHKKPVGVRLLSLPNIRNGSPVPCWIALTSISKARLSLVSYKIAAAIAAGENVTFEFHGETVALTGDEILVSTESA